MKNASRNIEPREIPSDVSVNYPVESAIIPTSFWLGGLKIDVVFDESLIKSKNIIGEARYCKQQILLDPSMAPLQMLEQSFMHELVHWIFYMMGEDEMRGNEKLVDLFAHFLYQAKMTEQKEITQTLSSDLSAELQGE